MDAADATAGPDRESRHSRGFHGADQPGRGRRVGPAALTASTPQRFSFVQFDFAGGLGLTDGRYLTEERHVLVISTLGAQPRSSKRFGHRPGTEAEAPTRLVVTRVTAVRSDAPLSATGTPDAWLKELKTDRERLDTEIGWAIGLLNRALHALALAEGDPYIGERRAGQAVEVRLGHGLGPELAEGNFSQAITVEAERRRRRRRSDGVGSQERMAAILSGRERPDVCETLMLRARSDFNAGRLGEALACLDPAVTLMLIELEGALNDPAHTADLSAIQGRREELRQLARSAWDYTGSPPDAAAMAVVESILTLGERVLRRRRLLRG